MSIRKEFGFVKHIVASGAGMIKLGERGAIEGADTVTYDADTFTLTLVAGTAFVSTTVFTSPKGDIYSASGGIAMMTGGTVTVNHLSVGGTMTVNRLSIGGNVINTGTSDAVQAQQKCEYSFHQFAGGLVTVKTSGSVRLKFYSYLLHPRTASILASGASAVCVVSCGYAGDVARPLKSLSLVASGSATIESDGDCKVGTLTAVTSGAATVLGFSVSDNLVATASGSSTIDLAIKGGTQVTQAAGEAAIVKLHNNDAE